MDPKPVTLEGRYARLEPLSLAHAAQLFEVAREPSIWSYMPVFPPKSVADVEGWIREAQKELEFGVQLPFAIVSLATNCAVGSSRYLDIRRAHRGLEIGWTWLAPHVQRSGVNTECKLMLLRHAFDELGVLRVQLKTDGRNEKSQRAIERLGATREGVLRRHIVCPDGFVRDTVMYSILREEWPSVRARLEALLERG